MKLITLLIFAGYTVLSLTAYSQGRKHFEDLGDNELERKNYSSSIYFYNQIFHPSAGIEDPSYNPYSTIAYNQEPKGNLDSIHVIVPEKLKSHEIDVAHKMAFAHNLSKDYLKAEEWYNLVSKYPSENFPYSLYEHGNILLANGKYDASIKVYQEFLKLLDAENPMVEKTNARIASAQFAKELGEGIGVNIALAGKELNAGSTSFAMMGSNSNYIFTSARKDSNSVNSSSFLTNIYTIDKSQNGEFSNLKAMSFEINSPMNEGAAAISPDGKRLVFSRRNTKSQMLSLLESRYLNGIWSVPAPLDFTVNGAGFNSSSPSFSSDGKLLFYASDKPGSIGGYDIWQVSIDNDGVLNDPRNLGTNVNTVFDENSPFYHTPSKTLYFSSIGHIGMGGYDVFQSGINPSTDWYGLSKNMGKPVNSSRDETYFIIDSLLREGFVTSDRKVCDDCNEKSLVQSHCNKIYSIKKDEIVITLSGYVFNKDTEEKLANAKVQIKDIRGALTPSIIITDKTGFYKTELKINQEFILKATLKDYFADGGVENTIGINQSTNLLHDFFLSPIPKGEIAIEGIEYDYNKATLREKSMIELDKLVKFLELNDNLSVQIRSHTDARGSGEYNQKLSQGRAKSVVDYLILKGIDPKKLIALGMGENEPCIIKGPDGNDLQLLEATINMQATEAIREDYHQRNRRTALKVLAE